MGCTLPDELILVGSSLPELATALESSFEKHSAATKVDFVSRGTGGTTVALLVIQSSLIDIKLIIS